MWIKSVPEKYLLEKMRQEHQARLHTTTRENSKEKRSLIVDWDNIRKRFEPLLRPEQKSTPSKWWLVIYTATLLLSELRSRMAWISAAPPLDDSAGVGDTSQMPQSVLNSQFAWFWARKNKSSDVENPENTVQEGNSRGLEAAYTVPSFPFNMISKDPQILDLLLGQANKKKPVNEASDVPQVRTAYVETDDEEAEVQ